MSEMHENGFVFSSSQIILYFQRFCYREVKLLKVKLVLLQITNPNRNGIVEYNALYCLQGLSINAPVKIYTWNRG